MAERKTGGGKRGGKKVAASGRVESQGKKAAGPRRAVSGGGKAANSGRGRPRSGRKITASARAKRKSEESRRGKKQGGAGRHPPIRAIISCLEKEYPESKIALEFGNPLELLVATILAAQCTDERVNQVTKTLFAKYKTAGDYARAPLEDLMELVRSTGFFRAKSKNISAACRMIEEKHGGEVPSTMEELVELPGVARKTANIVLADAFETTEGIAVDTHMLRLSGRLGLSSEKDPVKVESDLVEVVPKSKWSHLPHLIADHGRAVCKARSPRCEACVLADLCPSRDLFMKGSSKAAGAARGKAGWKVAKRVGLGARKSRASSK